MRKIKFFSVFSAGRLTWVAGSLMKHDTVFNSKTKNLIDSLIHSTQEEILTLIRTIKLLTLAYKLETKFFYKDNTIEEIKGLNNKKD
jgi:hypothetical protein